MQNNPAQNAPEIILPMERLDQVLFKMDTTHIKDSLLARNNRYPFISEVLLKQMLAIDSGDSESGLLSFLNAYRPIYSAVQKLNSPATAHPQLQTLFKNVHYYFPAYNLPKKIIYFIGPLDGFGNAIGSNYMAIGLLKTTESLIIYLHATEFFSITHPQDEVKTSLKRKS